MSNSFSVFLKIVSIASVGGQGNGGFALLFWTSDGASGARSRTRAFVPRSFPNTKRAEDHADGVQRRSQVLRVELRRESIRERSLRGDHRGLRLFEAGLKLSEVEKVLPAQFPPLL